MGTNASTSKRPRLDSFASTGHLGTSPSYSGTRAQPGLEVDTSSSHQRDNNEDNEDVPSGPPSASFSNLTITQPPSPAYAAFSTETPTAGPSLRLDSPTSPHLFDYAQAETRRRDEQNHHESMDCEMQVDQQRSTLPLPSIIVGQQEGQSSQSGSSDPSALSSTSTARNITTASRRRGKSPSRTRARAPSSYSSSSSMRRRLRRATSLPLEDEIFIAKRQMDHAHRRSISCLSNPSNTANGQQMALAEIGLQNGGGGEMKEDELMIGVTPAVAAGALVDEVVDGNPSSTYNRPPMDAALASTSTSESSSQTPEGRPPLARSTRAYNPKHSGDNDKITNQTVAPSLVTPAQLAAMHQFNMPKPPPMPVLVPPPGLGFRGASHFPPFPTRTLQAYAQAQRRLLAPTVQARVASVPNAALDGAAYRSSLVFAFPPPANASVADLPGPSLIQAPIAQQQQQEKKKTSPTASIPGYAPPIAKDTLRELDLQEVLQCRQLRHDVVFDANLMFRPNFDGDR